jgi:hypothetical protein
LDVGGVLYITQRKKTHAEDAGNIGVALNRLPDLGSFQVVLLPFGLSLGKPLYLDSD